MKRDIAKQLLDEEIIAENHYDMVSKVFSGVTIPQTKFIEGVDYMVDSVYSFSGKLGNPKYNCELEIENEENKLRIKYELFGLRFEISQDNDNNIGLHVRREKFAGPYGGRTLRYYMIDKEDADDHIKVRCYDKDSCSLMREISTKKFLELEDFEEAEIFPDEEFTVKDTDEIDFASSLISPFTKGIGNFEETISDLNQIVLKKNKI